MSGIEKENASNKKYMLQIIYLEPETVDTEVQCLAC
jgi:hypothetical protein